MEAYFGGIKLGYKKNVTIEDIPVINTIYSKRSLLVDRLLKNICELCGTNGNIEMHHVRKIKDLERDNRKEIPLWMKRMIAMRRKTLAVCKTCHIKIHTGNYNGKKITDN